MSQTKKSKAEIIDGIINLVSTSPKSIYELSKKLNSNWDTIKDNVELLKKLNVLDISENKVFLKQDSLISIHKDTIAGLPLSKEVRTRIYALAKKVNDMWLEKKGEVPKKTQMQKALVEISEQNPNLNIPRGWYFFGKVVLVKIDPEEFSKDLKNYNFKKYKIDEDKLNQSISSVIDEIESLSYNELLDYQYNKYNKKDYLTKREIENLLMSDSFDKKKFAQLLYQLLFNFKINKDDSLNYQVLTVMKDAISVLLSSTAKFDKDVQELKPELFESFTILWKIYCTFNLSDTLEGDLGYDKKIIDSIFEDRINFYTNDLNDYFTNSMLN